MITIVDLLTRKSQLQAELDSPAKIRAELDQLEAEIQATKAAEAAKAKAAAQAAKVKAAEAEYLKAVKALAALSEALDRLAAVQPYPPIGHIPGDLHSRITAAMELLKWAEPESLGLPPRPTLAQQAQAERQAAEVRKRELISQAKAALKTATGAARNDAERRLKDLTGE